MEEKASQPVEPASAAFGATPEPARGSGAAGPSQPRSPATGSRRWRLTRRGRTRLLATVAVALAVGVLLPSVVGSEGLVLHWSCTNETLVGHRIDSWIPAVLVNSPFGGTGTGVGWFPWTFPGVWNGPPPPPGNNLKIGVGIDLTNGTAGAALFEVNLSFYRIGNESVFGPGANVRCTSQFRVVPLAPYQYGTATRLTPKPSNTSDFGEPTNVITPNGNSSPSFENSYISANSPSVSTCGGPPFMRPMIISSRLTLDFPVEIDGRNYTVPYDLPVEQLFNYTFPANFGTWQIDNLSTPGERGGGWAFSYSPCV